MLVFDFRWYRYCGCVGFFYDFKVVIVNCICLIGYVKLIVFYYDLFYILMDF